MARFACGFAFFLALASPLTTWGAQRVTLDRLEASVNSSIILTSDVRKFREVSKLRAQLDPLFAGTPLASEGPKATSKDIIEFLINDRLISQSFPKSDSDVEQEINSIQNNNRLDRATLKAALAKEGFQFPDYVELIRSSGSKRDLIDRDIRTKVNITDDDVKNYYYNHLSKSAEGGRSYHLKLITISASSFKNPAVLNKTANQALKDIRGGESFEEVARRVSDHPTAPTGGDLGVLTEEEMLPDIKKEIRKLRIGQVSDLLGSGGPSGRYYIVKLVDVKSNESERLEKMKEEIRAKLAATEFQHQIDLWLDRQRQTAFIHRAGQPAPKPVSAPSR